MSPAHMQQISNKELLYKFISISMYNYIHTYSGVDNNKHIARIAQMTQVDILKTWIK